jgi:hypothetical protein
MISKMLKEIINVKIQRSISTYLDDSEYVDFVDQIYRKEIDPYTAADMILNMGSGGQK